MLVIGGRNPSVYSDTFDQYWIPHDPWTRSMNVFDMSSLNWTGRHNAGAAYQRPAMVDRYYANK